MEMKQQTNTQIEALKSTLNLKNSNSLNFKPPSQK